jgi:hypothetical protein
MHRDRSWRRAGIRGGRSGAESRPVDPKGVCSRVAELAAVRGDRLGLGADPEIRSDQKLPSSVGHPERQSVGHPERQSVGPARAAVRVT